MGAGPAAAWRAGWLAIRETLRRDLYRGIVWWNRTQTIQREGTKKQRPRPETDWLKLDAPELRIVSPDLWAHVEARRVRIESIYLRGPKGRLVSRPTGEDQRSAYLLTSLAKCMTCGGSLVAAKRTAKHRYTRTVYRCAYHLKRGDAVCTNNLEIHQDILDSAILHAMNEAVDARVLEGSVATALARLRTDQQQAPDKKHSASIRSYAVELAHERVPNRSQGAKTLTHDLLLLTLSKPKIPDHSPFGPDGHKSDPVIGPLADCPKITAIALVKQR